MPTIHEITSDPDFAKLSQAGQRKALAHFFPDFAQLNAGDQTKVIRHFNPQFKAQEKRNPFSLTTGLQPDAGEVAGYVTKEVGGGIWDAIKGTAGLFAPPKTTGEKALGFLGPEALPIKRVGESLWGALKQSSQVPGAIRDLYQSPYGVASVAYAAPRAAGQVAGGELLGKAVKGAITGVSGVSEAAEAPSGSRAQSAAQSYVGAGSELTEDFAKRKATEQAKAVEKVESKNLSETEKHTQALKDTEAARIEAEREAAAKTGQRHVDYVKKSAKVVKENAEAAKEYEAAKSRVEEVNKAQEEAVGKRAELAKKINEDSKSFGQNLNTLEKAIKAKAKTLYKPVDDATEGATIPSDEAADLVVHAEDNILQGSAENIKQFREILSRGVEEEAPDIQTSMGRLSPTHPLYAKLVREGAITPPETEPIPLRDAQGFVTELGEALYKRTGLLGDVRRALEYVRSGLQDQLNNVYEEHGVLDQANAANKFWSKYQKTFHNMQSIKTRGGSPVARAIRAVDPQYIRDPFLSEATGERALALVKDYATDPDLGQVATSVANQAEQLASDYDTFKKAPSKVKPLVTPEPPKLKSLPESPKATLPKEVKEPSPPSIQPLPEPPSVEEMAKELKELKRGEIKKTAKSVGRFSRYDVASIGYGGVELARGEFPYAWAYTLARYGTKTLLDSPKVLEWLSEPTPTDLDTLTNLFKDNPSGKAQAQATITKTLSDWGEQGKKVPLGPFVGFLTPEQMKRVTSIYEKGKEVVKGEEGFAKVPFTGGRGAIQGEVVSDIAPRSQTQASTAIDAIEAQAKQNHIRFKTDPNTGFKLTDISDAKLPDHAREGVEATVRVLDEARRATTETERKAALNKLSEVSWDKMHMNMIEDPGGWLYLAYHKWVQQQLSNLPPVAIEGESKALTPPSQERGPNPIIDANGRRRWE